MLQPSSPIARPAKPVSTDQLRELITDIDLQVKLKRVKDYTSLRDAEIDSLDFYNLILAIEEAYGIVVPSDDLGKVNTLDNIAKYLNERLP
jgi:acyl carrier protein